MDEKKDNISDVRLRRTKSPPTEELALWVVIRKSTTALSFENYSRFMDAVPCDFADAAELYRLLKIATESFLLVNGGIQNKFLDEYTNTDHSALNSDDVKDFWNRYLEITNGAENAMLPYMALMRSKLESKEFKSRSFFNESAALPDRQETERYTDVLRRKLLKPFLLELIWSYWHEEGMLVQTMNTISRRFQNVRNPGADPLASLETDSLRPLNNLLWGYVQDEQHRLSVVRRAHEYDHHYGISLRGKAAPRRQADSRSKFIEVFHHLLHLCSAFFNQDDDTTVIADGAPLLNALKKARIVLSQAAQDRFGDVASTARQEMLLQQWILARPEFQKFLSIKVDAAYSEPWMGRVETIKLLQGWGNVPVTHFHDLAVFGERILLSICYSTFSTNGHSANWARYWRAEIQGYIHAYRAVTGVDLTASSP